MKIERRRYQEGDETGITLRPIFLETAISSIEGLKKRDGSFIETLLLDGVPIFIGGIVVQWRGCATLWSISANTVEKVPKEFHAHVLDMIEEYTRIFKIRRVQFNVRCDYKQGARWAETLGFSRECLMMKFDPDGRDYYRYVRFAEHG